MTNQQLLHKRLEQVVSAYSQLPQAIALFRPLSNETFSRDSDEGIILQGVVKKGSKYALLDNLSWLSTVQHIAFAYPRSKDGYRVLFSDGVFCDFSLHEKKELLDTMPDDKTLLWSESGFNKGLAVPEMRSDIDTEQPNWLLGEMLTNMIIGLRRFAQGEKLSAYECIQQNALSKLISLILLWHPESQGKMPTQDQSRFIEQHFPDLKPYLGEFGAGYEHSPDSALAMLDYIERYLPVNHFMKDQILNMAKVCRHS